MKSTRLHSSALCVKPQSAGRSALFLIFFALLFTGHAQLIAWDASNNGGGFGATPWAPATLNANISMVGTGLIRGANILTSGTPAGGCWGGGGGGWGVTDAGSVYFSFTPNTGSQVSLSGISSCLRRSAQGPTSYNVEYSVNGGAYVFVGSWSSNVTSGTTGQANSSVLSGFANLQNIQAGTVIKFRISFPNAAGGNWYVTNGANSLVLSGTVSSFNVPISLTSSIQCHGQATGVLTASVSGGMPPFTYSWMPSGGSASVATGLAAGVYTCVVTSSSSQTTASTFTITEPAALTASIVGVDSVSCHGGTNGSATVTASGSTGPYTYSWMPSGGFSSVAANLSQGDYTINISDANQCSTLTQTISVFQPTMAIVNAIASHTAVCNGATVTLNGSGASTYTWTGGVVNGFPFTPTATAVYTVSASNATTGCSGTKTVSVIVYNTPTVTISSSSGTVLVACEQSTFSLSGAGAATYTWSGGISNGVAFTPSASAAYTVNATDTNGCAGSATIQINISANPTVQVTTDKGLLCKGENAVLKATGAGSYLWSSSTSSMATTPSVVVSPTITTSYTVVGKDNNGCSTSTVISQKVSSCTGLESMDAEMAMVLTVFPNPSSGAVTVRAHEDLNLVVLNELGQIIRTLSLDSTNQREMQINDLRSGVYMIISRDKTLSVKQKLVVTN